MHETSSRTLLANLPFNKARNTTSFYLSSRNLLPPVSSLLNSPSIHEELLPNAIHSVFQIAFTYCVRISELLNSIIKHTLSPDRLVCEGLKGSNSCLIYVPGLSKYVSLLDNPSPYDKLFNVTYSQCYRWARKIGIQSYLLSRKNSAVTHLSRFVMARSLTGVVSQNVIGECLRHRSRSTVLYYLNKGASSNGKT